MIQTRQTSPFERVDVVSKTTHVRPNEPSTKANLVTLEQGLYLLEIGESAAMDGQVSGLAVPAIQVLVPPHERDGSVEIMGASRRGDTWLGREGGTVIVRSPSSGAFVLVTAYGLPAQDVSIPEIQLRRLDRPGSNATSLRSTPLSEEPHEIGSEIVLHLERLGDQRFPGEGWVGNRGKKLRIEAFSIRPVDTLLARDIEFKALGPRGRQTPWVTDAKLCGTRGQGLPLTGFAIRLTPHAAERFDVVYQGAFFESGVVGPHRNGELCMPPIADDPLEAINVRLIRRSCP
jgi:hydrophobic W protein